MFVTGLFMTGLFMTVLLEKAGPLIFSRNQCVGTKL